MWILVGILHVFVCLVLILVILLQQGKGGGMGAAFGGSTAQVFGGRGAGNILTRGTAICAATFMLTSVALAWHASEHDRGLAARATRESSRIKEKGELKEHAKEPGETKPVEPAPGETKPVEPAPEAPKAP
jgi:preprotein translocase subunit SecG